MSTTQTLALALIELLIADNIDVAFRGNDSVIFFYGKEYNIALSERFQSISFYRLDPCEDRSANARDYINRPQELIKMLTRTR